MSQPPPEQRWYLMFKDDDENLVGLTGPYIHYDAARYAMDALLAADAKAMEGWDLDSVGPEAQCIYAPYRYVQCIALSPPEIMALV